MFHLTTFALENRGQVVPTLHVQIIAQNRLKYIPLKFTTSLKANVFDILANYESIKKLNVFKSFARTLINTVL